MSTLSGWKGSFFFVMHRAPTEQEIFDEGVAEGKRRYAARPYSVDKMLPAYDPVMGTKPIPVQVWTKGNDLPIGAFYGRSDSHGMPFFHDGKYPIENVEIWSYPEQ
jgi:hypothetical protein